MSQASRVGLSGGSTRRWRSDARAARRRSDSLFTLPFLLAALFNIAPALLLNPIPTELIFVGGAHALFVLRLVVARLAAGRQRAIDLERFRQLKKYNA